MHVVFFLLVVAFQDTPGHTFDLTKLSGESLEEYYRAIDGLLENEQVRKEMEILPSQLSEFRKKIGEANTQMNERRMKNSASDTRDFNQKMADSQRESIQVLNSTLEEVLLPHQLQQLNQLVVWSLIKSKLQSGSPFQSKRPPFQSVLVSGAIRELVGVDVSQAEQIQKSADEMQDEFARELAALHQKYEEKLREALTAEQQEKLKALVGETPAFYFR